VTKEQNARVVMSARCAAKTAVVSAVMVSVEKEHANCIQIFIAASGGNKTPRDLRGGNLWRK